VSASAFDHPLLGAWMGDPATLAALSWESEVAALMRFWTALAEAQAEAGIIPLASTAAVVAALAAPPPAPAALAARTRADGVVVPGLVEALRSRLPEAAKAHLHHGATSQDAVDTALTLRLQGALADHGARLDALASDLDVLAARYGDRPLTAVTRLRDALPITTGDRIDVWRAGLNEAAHGCRAARDALPVQLGGPVGTLAVLAPHGPAVRAGLARRLGLTDPGRGWHTTRGPIVDGGRAFEVTARSLGKLGLDLGLMAMDPVSAVSLAGGASSSMPHKVNPVDAELLVALSRHAAVLLGALAGTGLHELERSGAGWTGEWLTLPPLVACAGGALAAAERLLASVRDLAPRGAS
jgi:3-carboxy-cis,cis-muconate cycloisomerase